MSAGAIGQGCLLNDLSLLPLGVALQKHRESES